MAKLVVSDGFGINTTAQGGGPAPVITNETPEGFRADRGGGDYVDFKGKNIKYDSSDGTPVSGSISSEKSYLDGLLFYRLTKLKEDIAIFNQKSGLGIAKYEFRKDDQFFGGDMADILVSWGGDDVIKAGAGDDVLNGWKGNDKLFGEEGKDDFYFAKGYDKDVIKDISKKKDNVILDENLGITGFKDIKKAASDYKKGVKLDFGNGDVLKIQGVSKDQLDKVAFFPGDWDL